MGFTSSKSTPRPQALEQRPLFSSSSLYSSCVSAFRGVIDTTSNTTLTDNSIAHTTTPLVSNSRTHRRYSSITKCILHQIQKIDTEQVLFLANMIVLLHKILHVIVITIVESRGEVLHSPRTLSEPHKSWCTKWK